MCVVCVCVCMCVCICSCACIQCDPIWIKLMVEWDESPFKLYGINYHGLSRLQRVRGRLPFFSVHPSSSPVPWSCCFPLRVALPFLCISRRPFRIGHRVQSRADTHPGLKTETSSLPRCPAGSTNPIGKRGPRPKACACVPPQRVCVSVPIRVSSWIFHFWLARYS